MIKESQTILNDLQVRKTKAQKNKFISFIFDYSQKLGYPCRTENGYLSAKNIVIGNPDTAKIVYTAHYDTCAKLPFPNFITPKNFLVYMLYQIAVMLMFLFIPMYLLFALLSAIDTIITIPFEVYAFVEYVLILGFLVMLLFGPANKHTANDNTSGVITLIEIMNALPDDNKNAAAFIFFDLEEAGLFGSMAFASKHKKNMKETLLINFDCVSDGEHMLFAVKAKARKHIQALKNAFEADGNIASVDIGSKGVFYPSDQANFPMGIGVAALKQSKMFRIKYMDRIHTPKDTVFRQENIEYLSRGAVALAEMFK